MKNLVDLTDDELEQRFENCLIDAALFTHEAHLRLAWIHIEKYGVEKAINNILNYSKSIALHSYHK